LTLIEMIVCTVIIGILSATALPLSREVVRQAKEDALRDRLQTLRMAIDRYREKIFSQTPGLAEADCYPRSLEDLVTARVLRRIPSDPITQQPVWGVRSSSDPDASEITDGRNVFDVHTLASGTARDGTAYSTW
jgi:general secretion pathway protein G